MILRTASASTPLMTFRCCWNRLRPSNDAILFKITSGTRPSIATFSFQRMPDLVKRELLEPPPSALPGAPVVDSPSLWSFSRIYSFADPSSEESQRFLADGVTVPLVKMLTLYLQTVLYKNAFHAVGTKMGEGG